MKMTRQDIRARCMMSVVLNGPLGVFECAGCDGVQTPIAYGSSRQPCEGAIIAKANTAAETTMGRAK
jgi:hypothetical protein